MLPKATVSLWAGQRDAHGRHIEEEGSRQWCGWLSCDNTLDKPEKQRHTSPGMAMQARYCVLRVLHWAHSQSTISIPGISICWKQA